MRRILHTLLKALHNLTRNGAFVIFALVVITVMQLLLLLLGLSSAAFCHDLGCTGDVSLRILLPNDHAIGAHVGPSNVLRRQERGHRRAQRVIRRPHTVCVLLSVSFL